MSAPQPVSAPGKALLIGEYAVLEGATAVVTAVDVRAIAHTSDAVSTSPVTRAARSHIAGYLAARGHASPGSAPLIDTSAFTIGPRKIGLGSSAAVAAAVVGFHLQEAGFDLHDPEIRADALALARSAHAEAQGGGSGADVAAAVLGGTLCYTDGRASAIDSPTWLHTAFIDAGAPAVTSHFVALVRAAAAAAPAAYNDAIARLRAASQRFIAALAEPSGAAFAALAAAVTLHNDGLRALQALSGAPLLTPTIDLILHEAHALGIAAKPSGAGGGDLVVAFAPAGADLDRLADRLRRRHGVEALNGLSIAAAGLRAESRPPRCSRLAGLFRLDIAGRRAAVAEAADLPLADFNALDPGAFALEQAEHMIENVIGTLALPLAVATNFRINGLDLLIPMCVEEASVVAAASNAAKMVRAGGGFIASADPPWMIAQIQLCRRAEGRPIDDAVRAILAEEPALRRLADSAHPRLVARGGGARELEVRPLAADMLAVHVVVDCRDAMGANLLNTIAELLAPRLAALTGWTAGLRILSNLADRRRAHVRCRIPPEALASDGWRGAEVVDGIVSASRFAELDPYRAATHNKGIMNGVDAVILATGNDWRAMEAGAHAYAAESGRYRPLATWSRGEGGWLEGVIALPAAVGLVGGATHVHPAARLALQILGPRSAVELGQAAAAVGLASNLAALRALATEGIQRGHMSLHARTLAVGAGASGDEIDLLVHRLIASHEIKHERALALLQEIRAEASL